MTSGPTLTMALLLQAVRERVLAEAAAGELESQFLYLTDGHKLKPYRVEHAVPGGMLATWARMQIRDESMQVVHAALVFEGWTVRYTPPDPIAQDLEARRVEPREWPESYRTEVVCILGDSLAGGFTIFEAYVVGHDQDGRRTFTRDRSPEMTHFRSHMLPLIGRPERSPN